MMTLHFLNDVADDAESKQKLKKFVIIASLKSVQQWENQARGFWYQIYHAMSTSVLIALPGKLDIKRHLTSILYLYTKLA